MNLYKALKPYIIIERTIKSNKIKIYNDIFLEKIKLNIAIKKSIYSIKESICRTFLYRTTKNFNYKNINFYNSDKKTI